MDDVEAADVLLSAVYRKNDREVFARMFDVNKKDDRELGPLHYCVAYESIGCAAALLANGARSDLSFKGLHPVHMAALMGKSEILRVFLERGGDCDAPDYQSNATPIFYAAFAGSIPCVDLLLAKGAFVDAEDRSGLTALLVAGMCENVPMISHLLQRSTKPVLSSFDGTVHGKD